MTSQIKNEPAGQHAPSETALRERAEASAAVRRALPPDPEGMNDDRAEWAQHALTSFAQVTGMDEGGGNEEDATILGDLLANLMHWCDRRGINFSDELADARSCYEEETAGEVNPEDPPQDDAIEHPR